METGSVGTSRQTQTYRAVTALSVSLVLSVIYLLFRNWLMGGWIRLEPGWTSIGHAWVLHLGAFLILGVVPFLLRTRGGITFREQIRAVWAAYPLWMKVTAVLIAIGISIGSNTDPCLRSAYPIPDATPWSIVRYLAFMPSYLIYYIAFEYHYRGFLLPVLRERFGSTPALLLQSIPPTLLHIGLCPSELMGSFPGQLALGWIALRGGSYWPAVILHAITGITLDITILLSRGAI